MFIDDPSVRRCHQSCQRAEIVAAPTASSTNLALTCTAPTPITQSFDKDNIPSKVIRSLKSYMENPQFQAEEVAKVTKTQLRSITKKGRCVGGVEIFETKND